MSEHIFGPVPSRRLGFSLGVDIVPFKTCAFDCIYCECGKTTDLTLERKSYVDITEVYKDLEQTVNSESNIDYITFSGSGEPTLNIDIGILIKKIKKNFTIPVAVITNGSLLFMEEVRKDLMSADLILPSIDACIQATFNKINRPVKGITIKKIIEGLSAFRKEYKGKIWLEILVAANVNDDYAELEKLAGIINNIKPDKVQLNTCVRPGTEENIEPVSMKQMERVSEFFSVPVEIVSSFSKNINLKLNSDEIIKIIERRPCTIEDIIFVTGLKKSEILKKIDYLQTKGVNIKINKKEGKVFYSIN